MRASPSHRERQRLAATEDQLVLFPAEDATRAVSSNHTRPAGGRDGLNAGAVSNTLPGGRVAAVVDLVTAAKWLGIGRTVAYQLVRQGRWPSPVLRLGHQIKVPTGPLLELLGLSPDEAADLPLSSTQRHADLRARG